MMLYILNPDHSFKKVKGEEFVWQDGKQRRVAYSDLGKKGQVSTVFLAVDHNFGRGPPILFETMVFGGPMDGECFRYHTWDEAVEGHEMVAQTLKRARRPRNSTT